MHTEKILIERYGPYLTLEQLAELLHREPQSLRTSLRLESHALAPLARILGHFVPLIGHQEIKVLSYFPDHLAVANTCAIALLAFLARFRAFLSWG